MDLLDRLLQHDCWTTGQLLKRANALSAAELDREFDIGHRSVRKTFIHLIRNMEIWAGLMASAIEVSSNNQSTESRLESPDPDIRRSESDSVDEGHQRSPLASNQARLSKESPVTIEDLMSRLDKAAHRFAAVARVVSEQNRWDEQWLDSIDNQMKSYGTGIAHLITHSMHHRGQLLYLFRKLGMKDIPEGDVFSWENAVADSSE